MADDYYDLYAIEAQPVYTLAECIELCKKRLDEDEIADRAALAENIAQRFRSALFIMNDAQLDFLREFVPISLRREPFTQTLHGGFLMLYFRYFAYPFLWNEQKYIALPDELVEVYHRTLAEPDFAGRLAHNQEVFAYANALLGLYGFYEVYWLAQVWNQHHRDKITQAEARQVLSDMESFHCEFWLDDDLVIHESLDEDEFDALYRQVEDMDYFMPTKSVIAMYASADESYIECTPGAKAMSDFLATMIADEGELEDLGFEIFMTCERLEPPGFVRILLENAGFPLEDAQAVAQFEKLYQRLRGNTHVWELRGYTLDQYQVKNSKHLERFTLPAATAQKNKRKKN